MGGFMIARYDPRSVRRKRSVQVVYFCFYTRSGNRTLSISQTGRSLGVEHFYTHPSAVSASR